MGHSTGGQAGHLEASLWGRQAAEWWKLVAKVICRQRAKAFRSRFCGSPGDGSQGPRAAQVGVAVKGGADLGVHVVQAALDQHPEWVCVKADAKNAFNAVHREAVFEAIERDFPELWAWTDLWYGVEANLGFRLGNADGSVMRFIKLRENAQQGDPLGPPYLAAPLQAVLERVQERHLAVVVMAYLDDVHLIGPPVLAAAAYDTYLEEADLVPGGVLASHSLEFATLPHGMGLTKATR
eukprot:gene34245-biopygen22137